MDGRTQDSNIKTRTIRNPLQNSQLIHDPLCFQICQPDNKNPQYERFLRPNPSIWRPIHPLIIGRLKSLRTSAFYWGQLKSKFRIQQHSILVYVSPSLHPPTQRFSCLSARQEILIMHSCVVKVNKNLTASCLPIPFSLSQRYSYKGEQKCTPYILTVWKDSGAIQQSKNGIERCLQINKEIMKLKLKALSPPQLVYITWRVYFEPHYWFSPLRAKDACSLYHLWRHQFKCHQIFLIYPRFLLFLLIENNNIERYCMN